VWLLLCLVAVAGLREQEASSKKGRNLVSEYGFYHTTDQIHEELKALSHSCPELSMKTESRPSPSSDSDDLVVLIDFIRIKRKGKEPAQNRAFFLFGEHARELISPESALHFIRTLCGKEKDLRNEASALLDTTEFLIVANANPISRKKVEEGEYCLRGNEREVDLNRNWDEEWQPDDGSAMSAETNPGPSPFSEVETQILRDAVDDFRPSLFLTIHSGTLGMYMPWAYSRSEAVRNQAGMLDVLQDLDDKYCQCPFGAAGKEVGYNCPGTCLDYVYDKLKTPFAFAFEIYAQPSSEDDLKERWRELKSESPNEALNQLGDERFSSLFSHHQSDFVLLSSSTKKQHMKMQAGNREELQSQSKSSVAIRAHRKEGKLDLSEPSECFSFFNPQSETELAESLQKWTQAYLRMTSLVAARLKKKESKAEKGEDTEDRQQQQVAPALLSIPSASSSNHLKRGAAVGGDTTVGRTQHLDSRVASQEHKAEGGHGSSRQVPVSLHSAGNGGGPH